jgi:hypothetical protein
MLTYADLFGLEARLEALPEDTQPVKQHLGGLEDRHRLR